MNIKMATTNPDDRTKINLVFFFEPYMAGDPLFADQESANRYKNKPNQPVLTSTRACTCICPVKESKPLKFRLGDYEGDVPEEYSCVGVLAFLDEGDASRYFYVSQKDLDRINGFKRNPSFTITPILKLDCLG